ncbi:ArnT family glycosyltransferase [Phormidium sp. CCY1219]|uniref:ArnT family glycosyltransferase n=1 Tax=Phormidium sp. CCY1219 TaxID=2886104 RepID=UPI002D1ECB78|nr:glycosyltransferase family 39 protein [Phormidium sp. CCY1219]MEB3830682.1 glycosyltransferase family 39 protein [Phormidium sp. CCY1219]
MPDWVICLRGDRPSPNTPTHPEETQIMFKVNQSMRWMLNHREPQGAIAWALGIIWLLFIGAIAFLWKLGDVGLIDETEPLFAEAARQMTVTDDWITPYFNQETRFDKPPLIYWLMAIAYRIIGVNEWAVRLPSALSAIGLMALLFLTLRYFSFSPSLPLSTPPHQPQKNTQPPALKPWIAAGLAAAIWALNIQTIAWGRIGVSDMLLNACMGGGLLAFFWGYALQDFPPETLSGKTADYAPAGEAEKPDKSLAFWLRNQGFWYGLFYVLIGCAVLTKGPVGIVLPGLIIGSFLLYVGKFWQVVGEMRIWRGLGIFLAIALPWYILVTLANGQTYLDSFFGYHNFERFTRVVNRHGEPWYFYLVVVLLGFAPWSVYLPVAIARLRLIQRDRLRHQPRFTHLGIFAFFWFASIFGFFTVAVTKLPSYILPALPAAAILVALVWAEFIFKPSPERGNTNRKMPDGFQISLIANWALIAIIAGGLYWVSQTLEPDPAMPNFPAALQESGLVWRGVGILIVTAVVGVLLLLRRQNRGAIALNIVGFMAFFIFALMPVYLLVDTHRQLPVRQLAEIIPAVKQPGEETIMVAFEKPSLVFYSHLPISFFRRSTDTRRYLQQVAQENSTPPQVLIVGYPNKIKGLGLRESYQYQLLAEAGNYRLIRVDKQLFLPQKNSGN